jgi:uncharacterized protein YhfF
MELSSEVTKCWQAYLATQDNPEETQKRFLETFSIGNTVESKNEGAQLIKAGVKTTTSELLWSYQNAAAEPPAVGSLSILLGGANQPVCIVETTRVEIKPFSDVGEQFAYDYGEWDRTLDTWRKHCWLYYSKSCEAIGRKPSETMPLVCEWLKVVHLCTNSS